MKKKLRDAQLALLSKFKTAWLANGPEVRFKIAKALEDKKKVDENQRIERAVAERAAQAEAERERAEASRGILGRMLG